MTIIVNKKNQSLSYFLVTQKYHKPNNLWFLNVGNCALLQCLWDCQQIQKEIKF